MRSLQKRREQRIALAVALALALLSSGCVSGARAVGPVARAAIWAAAIVGTAIVIAIHDDHQHHSACGHYRRWHADRWVYYYLDRWEFYDQESGRWYVYREELRKRNPARNGRAEREI